MKKATTKFFKNKRDVGQITLPKTVSESLGWAHKEQLLIHYNPKTKTATFKPLP